MRKFLYKRLPRTITALLVEVLVNGLWAEIDQQFFSDHAGWFIALSLAGLILVWFANQIIEFVRWKHGTIPLPSPIKVSEHLYADCSRIEDETGQRIEGVEALAFCLHVYNNIPSGETLRGVQAHLQFWQGQALRLKIRDTTDGRIDLRHGEQALIEIGSIYLAPADATAIRNVIPYTIKADHVFVARHDAEHGHRRLTIAEYSRLKDAAFGTFKEHSPEFSFWVTISAENVVSRNVRLVFDPHDGDWPNWLVVRESADDSIS